jgi:hypothetical protein
MATRPRQTAPALPPALAPCGAHDVLCQSCACVQSPNGFEVATFYRQNSENSLCMKHGTCFTGTVNDAKGRITSVRWEQILHFACATDDPQHPLGA